MVTAGELLAGIRAALGNGGAAWSDAELLGFLADGVREYSQHRPRQREAALAMLAGVRQYALPPEATAVLRVAYPAGAAPPLFVPRRSSRSRWFRYGRYYDVWLPGDGTGAPQLLLSFEPEPGTALLVAYTCPHDSELAAESALTVPAEHHHVLRQYVLFAAARQLQNREQAAPTNNSGLLMAQLASNTRRLELAYLGALNRILTHAQGEGEIVVWGG
jgi:hypothetical protein